MADWMLPNSNTHSLFSSMLGENMGSTAVSESTCEGESGFSFHGSHEHHASTNPNYGNGPQDHHTDHVDDGTSRSWAMCEQPMSPNGGGDLLERMASRGGFNAPILNTDTIRSGDFPQNWEALSPYLTIPSGLSPTTLLESPVFASDSLYNKTFNLDGLSSESADKNNENFFGRMDASSFAFRPTPDSGPSPNHFLGSSDRAPFSSIEVSVESENIFPHQTSEHSKAITITRKDNGGGNMLEQRAIHTVNAEVEQFPLLFDEQQIQDEEADPRGAGYVIAPGEDGYNWRKYGQKQAKGSDSLQGYYKCSHSHCLVKKKVELSQEGHITEIIYKGSHNHPKPSPARRSSHIALNEMQLRNGEHAAYTGGVGDLPEWRLDNSEGTSSAAMLGAEYSNGATTSLPVQNSSQFQSGNVADRSTTFSNDEDDDERGTHGCVSVACDGDGDESESKKRKADTSINCATRAIKDPRVVVQTTSEVDILDDGYRWRKYGQKVVKGNPNPRSYYKCTSTGCAVRKHVERASHDLNSVITTYEGKHNHDIPAARNNNTHVSSDVPNNNAAVQHRPEHSQQLHNMSQFQRATPFGSFGLPTGPHLIPPHDHLGYGMNQHSMPNMDLGVWGVNQADQYMGQPRTMNEMVMPKGEPKVEPMCDSGLSLPNASAVYQQVMSRMPLGPQM